MAIARGWNGEIVLQANISKEELGGYNASTNASFLASEYPFVDANNGITSNTSDVTLYVGNTSLDNTSFNITGASGFVHIHDNVGISGTAYLTYDIYRTLGYASGLSLSVGNDLEPIYVIGQKTAKEIVEGLKDVTGSIKEFFIDRRAWGRVTKENIDDEINKFMIKTRPHNNASYLLLKNLKFDSFDLTFSKEAIVEHDCDFIAENVSYD